MNDEILNKMEERRLNKHNQKICEQLDKEIKKDCKNAKERYNEFREV